MSANAIFIICWIMSKCLCLIRFEQGFLQTYSSRRIFWYKQFYVFSIAPKTFTILMNNVIVSHDLCVWIFIGLWLTKVWMLICNFGFFTIRVPYGRPISPIRPLFSCHGSFICVGCKSGISSGRLISLTGLPSSRLRSVSRKGRDLSKSPPSLPFGTGVPSCPLAGEPEAGFFVRGLFGSSSELSWRRPLFVLTVI